MSELMVVDGANVVGSVPDGWWRDRRGAAERLRDRLARRGGGEEIVLVVEGAARGVSSVPGVRVESAAGSGDDHIVDLVAGAGRPCVVVTADRELRRRVGELGASCVGPRTVYGGPDGDGGGDGGGDGDGHGGGHGVGDGGRGGGGRGD